MRMPHFVAEPVPFRSRFLHFIIFWTNFHEKCIAIALEILFLEFRFLSFSTFLLSYSPYKSYSKCALISFEIQPSRKIAVYPINKWNVFNHKCVYLEPKKHAELGFCSRQQLIHPKYQIKVFDTMHERREREINRIV